MSARNVLIIGLSSDIGARLGAFYRNNGDIVYGTSRKKINLMELGISDQNVFILDLNEKRSIDTCAGEITNSGLQFSLVIFSIGLLEPISPFYETDFDRWEESYLLNSVRQLRLLSLIRKQISSGGSVIFFHGGSPNGVLNNYSAYSIGKITLAKTVEYLHSEDKDLRYIIIGTGWVNTKIHNQSLGVGANAGHNLQRTQNFIAGKASGTSFLEIFECINWLTQQNRNTVGGRNFSVVFDAWGEKIGSQELLQKLNDDINMYKLRRLQK